MLAEEQLQEVFENRPRVICEEHPDWVRLYDEAWRVALKRIHVPEISGWKQQMICMPGSQNTWQWDSCFMAVFARYTNGLLPALANLDNYYTLQREDGFVAMAYNYMTGEPAYGERVNPPLFSWVEWESYLVSGDAARLESYLPSFVKLFDWLKANRTRPTGLYWFEDSGSSGMDNSPRSGYYAELLKGSDVCHVDLACQQALSAKCIASIARTLDSKQVAERFEEEYQTLKKQINDMHWSDHTRFYYDVFCRPKAIFHHNFLANKTVAAFWPMLAGIAEPHHVAGLVEHLQNPHEFATRHPVPSLSLDDPNYDPKGAYWRGSVWAPTNYMIARGLQVNGHGELAREIVGKHLDGMCEVLNSDEHSGIWECYSPEYALPATTERGDWVRDDFVGWSGLGPIASLIETMLGLEFDAAGNAVNWALDLDKRYGIEGIEFNGGVVSLVCNDADEGVVSVQNSRPFNLSIQGKGGAKGVFSLQAGSWNISLKNSTCQPVAS